MIGRTLYVFLFFSFSGFCQTTIKISVSDAKLELKSAVAKVEKVHYNAHFKNSLKEVLDFIDEELAGYKDQDPNTKDSISLKDLQRIGMRTIALMSNGHARLNWLNGNLVEELKAFEYLELTLLKDETGFYSGKDRSKEFRSYIHSINGVLIQEIIDELKAYLGGSDSFQEAFVMQLFPLLMFYSTKVKPPYTVYFADDTRFLARTQSFSEAIQMIQSETINSPYSYSIDDKETYIHFEYNSCENYERFEKFAEEMFQSAKQKSISKLIIDIRNNGGGNSQVNEILISYISKQKYRQSSGRRWKVSEIVQDQIRNDSLWYDFFDKDWIEKYLSLEPNSKYISKEYQLIKPKKRKYFFEGEVVLLTGGGTFSSANFLADAFKTYNMGIIIGQPTGENTNDFGEIVYVPSGRYGFELVIPTTFDIGADGNEERLEPVQPDVLVKDDAFLEALKYLEIE